MATNFDKYIVWVNYGSEGWNPVSTWNDWEQATKSMMDYMSRGNSDVIITEYIPVKVVPAQIVKE